MNCWGSPCAMTADTHNRRVALLGRPGPARERLSDVLEQSGAHCVLIADPTELELAQLVQAAPQVVMVVLDVQTEDVLEQFDAVLADPAIDVIYEEADQAASREGWDAARWQRHLVAKLQGHGNVLPPGSESVPAQQTGPAGAPTLVPGAAVYDAFDPLNAETDETLERPAPIELSPMELLDINLSLDSDEDAEGAQSTDSAESGFSFDLDLTDESSTPAPVDLSSEFDPALMMEATSDEPVVAASGADASRTVFGELELEADVGGVLATDSSESSRRFLDDLDSLQQRISGMELVDDTPRRGSAPTTGAVLVLSGIGGPDAVRQFLGALPRDFSRPVLVQQHLDGGRFDKLVTQLQRVSSLPVKLAEPGQPAQPGIVYILPAAIGLSTDAEGMAFTAGNGDILAALPSAGSAVVLLSGSDPSIVDTVMGHAGAGAYVAGQAADGCYDAAAPNALAVRGGVVAAPAELALRLSERWPTRGTEDVKA